MSRECVGNAAPLIKPVTKASPLPIFVGHSSPGKATLIEKLLLEMKLLAQ